MESVPMDDANHLIPVLIAIGANLGNPETKIHEAFQELEAMSLAGVKRSSIWKTSPVDCPAGSPDYFNAAASISTQWDTDPESFIRKLLSLEAQLGRHRSGSHNESRVIDLDLICMGSTQHSSTHLHLPHPRAHLRRFVLAPLAEIEPQFIIPGHEQSVVQLLKLLPDDDSGCIRWKSSPQPSG